MTLSTTPAAARASARSPRSSRSPRRTPGATRRPSRHPAEVSRRTRRAAAARPDRPTELALTWGTAPGQLWEIPSASVPGAVHRLFCGDATEPAHVARVMAGDRAAFMWTDPPYGVSYRGGTADALTIAGDDAAGLAGLLRGAFARADHVLVPGAPIYVAHPAGPNGLTYALEFQRVGWRYHQQLVWVKHAFVLGHSDHHYQHEPLIYGWKPGAAHPWFGGRTKTTLLAHKRPMRNALHPTMKPLSLITACIENSAAPAAIGYEPFSGSGSTLVAAEGAGRVVRAVELDPRYVAVALERMAGLGLAPRRVDG